MARSTAERARAGDQFECLAMHVDSQKITFAMPADGDPLTAAKEAALEHFGPGGDFASVVIIELEPVAPVTQLRPRAVKRPGGAA